MKKLGRMVALILTFSLLLASSAFAATKASSQILKERPCGKTPQT